MERNTGSHADRSIGTNAHDHESVNRGASISPVGGGQQGQPVPNSVGTPVTNYAGQSMGTGTRTSMGQGKQTGRDHVTFERQKHIGVLSTSPTGWTKELNIVSWNNRPARLDIREWCPDHQRMSRGIGIRGSEIPQLKRLLSDFDPESHGI